MRKSSKKIERFLHGLSRKVIAANTRAKENPKATHILIDTTTNSRSAFSLPLKKIKPEIQAAINDFMEKRGQK